MPGANTLVGSALPSPAELGNVNATQEAEPKAGGAGDGTEIFAGMLVLGAVGALVLFRLLGFQAIVGIQVGK